MRFTNKQLNVYDFRFPKNAVCSFEHGLIVPCEHVQIPFEAEDLKNESIINLSEMDETVQNYSSHLESSIKSQKTRKRDKQNAKKNDKIRENQSEHNLGTNSHQKSEALSLKSESENNEKSNFSISGVHSNFSEGTAPIDSSESSENSYQYRDCSENKESVDLELNEINLTSSAKRAQYQSRGSMDNIDPSVESEDFIELGTEDTVKKSPTQLLLFSTRKRGGLYWMNEFGYKKANEIKNLLVFDLIKEINRNIYKENNFLNLLNGKCKINQIYRPRNVKIRGICSFKAANILFILVLDSINQLRIFCKSKVTEPKIKMQIKIFENLESPSNEQNILTKAILKKRECFWKSCRSKNSKNTDSDENDLLDVDENPEEYFQLNEPIQHDPLSNDKIKFNLDDMDEQIIFSETDNSEPGQSVNGSLESLKNKIVTSPKRVGLLSLNFSKKLNQLLINYK